MVVASSAAAAVAIYVLHRRRRAASAIAPKRSWAHGVEVRPSRVAGAGDGLYASRDFAAGEELGRGVGRRREAAEGGEGLVLALGLVLV